MSVKYCSRKRFILLVLVLIATGAQIAVAQTSPLDRGKELFLENKMEEARPFLETALTQYPKDERIYLYLSTVYESLGQYERAVTLLQRGVQYAQDYLDVMYFNIANNMFKQNKNILAVEMYTKALEANPSLSEAYLNRANTALKVERYENASDDYKLYLQLQPNTPQRPQIEQVLSIIDGIVADQRAAAVEQERIRQEELARRKALLNQVLNSLENASKDTTNLSAETESVQDVEEKSDIVD